MKKNLTRKRSFRHDSFTLVELLVVIAIIAILAGVLLGAASYALKAAQRAKAANTANQIQSAALAYYTEYSLYPIPTAAITSPATDYKITDVAGQEAAWQALTYALSGNVHPATGLTTPAIGSPVPNTRSIAFLSLRSSDVTTTGTTDVPKNPLPSGTGATVNEIYFNIAMDSDYDGILGVAPSAVTTLPNFGASPFNATAAAGGGTCSAGVAVWANCSGTASTTPNAGFYVHTY